MKELLTLLYGVIEGTAIHHLRLGLARSAKYYGAYCTCIMLVTNMIEKK